MIVSMTGYGRGVARLAEFEAMAEVRSLNHRFFDVSVKLPRQLESKEAAVRETVRKYFERGRVHVTITLQQEEGAAVDLQLNTAVIDAYVMLLRALQKRAKIEAPLTLDQLLTFPDVFVPAKAEAVSETVWQAAKQALDMALSELSDMRRREGKEIEKDLLQRIELLGRYVGQIESISANRSRSEFNKLYARLRSLLDSGELDPTRLELEVALLADRVDVTEECIRLKSHLTIFLESVNQEAPAGRKLNFLLQEMNREANTIGAKACDAAIAHLVVKIKEEIEKLREQIQNIE